MTHTHALALGSRWLKHSQSPELDAEVLLAKLTRASRSQLLARGNQAVPWPTLVTYVWLLLRARRGRPIAYLVGAREFYGRSFKVTPATLVPRPETEILVEQALATIRANSSLNQVVDVGTGSGCIAITLALELPRLTVYASDASGAALTVARRNAKKYAVDERLQLLQGNLLEPFIQRHLLTPLTLVVANLPYLRPAEYIRALRFEPRSALVGGVDGITLYRELFLQLKALTPEQQPRVILLEVHPVTAAKVAALAKNIFPACQVQLTPDLSHNLRVLGLSLA